MDVASASALVSYALLVPQSRPIQGAYGVSSNDLFPMACQHEAILLAVTVDQNSERILSAECVFVIFSLYDMCHSSEVCDSRYSCMWLQSLWLKFVAPATPACEPSSLFCMEKLKPQQMLML